MTLKLFLLAVLFVISGGAAFSEYFKGRKVLSFLATVIAIIATFYLFQDIYDDLKQSSSSPQPPSLQLQPKQDLFETAEAFQARRHQLLQQFNDEVKQRNLDYQAGILHLTDYDSDRQMFTVNLYWQADWIKPFYRELQTQGVVRIGVKEAKQIDNEGTEKPLFITANLNDNQLEIQGVMVEKGRAYSILSNSMRSYRYIDNGNGTITDTRTGLIWLKNANCFGQQNWRTAMQSAAYLASGQCGLRDGSMRGMWRLPTKEELKAIVDKRYDNPALSNAAGTGQWQEGDAFSGVKVGEYWLSTPFASINIKSQISLGRGRVHLVLKSSPGYVWPLRGGQ